MRLETPAFTEARTDASIGTGPGVTGLALESTSAANVTE